MLREIRGSVWRRGVVDYVIAGEGEIALVRLLDELEAGRTPEGIPGIWSITAGQVQESVPSEVPDIEELPPPAFDLLDMDAYFGLDSPWHFPKSPKAVQFISSRGCLLHDRIPR